jgi:23S rRNA (uracil1939-C5)-methyltransferase
MSAPLRLQVEKMVYGGEGLSRADGEVILTPFVLAGETVDVELLASRQSVRRARLAAITKPSADRTTPPCAVFGRCGGCHYQHAAYSAQLRFKRDILVEALRRVGKIEYDPAAVGMVSGPPYGYRNRAQFHFENGRMGFREMHSHKLVPISECPVTAPLISGIATRLNQLVQDRRWPRFIGSLELFTDDAQVQWNVRETAQPVAKHFFEWMAAEFPGTVPGPLDYAVNDDMFRVSGDSFFQVNRFLLNELAESAIGELRGDTAWDLYAGVGFFSLPLARRFKHLAAVESGRSAAADLAFNADRAGLSIEVSTMSAEEWLLSAEKGPDVVLADPPRAGLGKTAVRRLLELRPATIVLIACDPTTLARDLAALTSGYTIDRVTMVDLFPQTFHIETIVTLVAGVGRSADTAR